VKYEEILLIYEKNFFEMKKVLFLNQRNGNDKCHVFDDVIIEKILNM
jgi:hypothetical protein